MGMERRQTGFWPAEGGLPGFKSAGGPDKWLDLLSELATCVISGSYVLYEYDGDELSRFRYLFEGGQLNRQRASIAWKSV
jgi:hypothetical protein